MNRPARRAILAVGVPGSGKTTLHKRITDCVILHPGYDSVFVLDRNEEWGGRLERHVGDLEAQLELLEEDEARVRGAVRAHGRIGLAARELDGPLIRNLAEYAEFCGLLASERKSDKPAMVPRRVIWRCGRDTTAYGDPLREACDQGNVMIVFSESPDWFTSYERDWPLDQVPGRPDVKLSQLYSQGRAHIRNRYGEPCAVHILCDAQSLAMVHWKVRQFSSTVLCSRVEGGESYRAISREFGDGTEELVRRVRALEPRQWIAIRGELPELAPFRGGGR